MLEDILIPIFICFLLPVAIVWIIGRTRQNETNRKTEVMLKAIENGASIDPSMFKRPEKEKTPKTIKKDLLDKLTGACITSFMGVAFLALYFLGVDYLHSLLPVAGGVLLAVGIGLFISYFVGQKMMAKEIEAEEEALKK